MEGGALGGYCLYPVLLSIIIAEKSLGLACESQERKRQACHRPTYETSMKSADSLDHHNYDCASTPSPCSCRAEMKIPWREGRDEGQRSWSLKVTRERLTRQIESE